MKIKITEDTPQTLKLTISGVDTALANALRRIMIAETKCWAVDYIDFFKNEALMSIEEIGNRMGLLPITAESEDANISLNYTADETKKLYARDLDYYQCEAIYPDMPLMILKKGQTINFVAYLRYTSKTEGKHAKWSPATAVFYDIPKENIFDFTIETTGVITPKELFSHGLDILQEKIKS
jgi:DNA-directed RNA polymerase alpha subunit